MQRGRTLLYLSLSLLALVALQPGILQAATIGVVVDDSFADGDRTKTGALDANWWSSNSTSGNSVEITTGALGLVSGTSGRGIHATFPTQNLNVGQTIIATYTYRTPATVGNNRSSSWRVALMDGSDPNLADDLLSSSSTPNPIYFNLEGYMGDIDVNTGSDADISIREHTVPNITGRFLGTTGEWDTLGSSSDAGYTIDPNTEYVGTFSITRTGADSVDITGTISQGGSLLDTNTESDVSGIANNYGMLGFWANSNVFGSSNASGDPDNGITFSNVTVEVIPEPSTVALCFGVATLLLGKRKRR